MELVEIIRGEAVSIPFTISDSGGALAGARVTWAAARALSGPRTLTKTSALGSPSSSSDITITTHSATSIVGTINITRADYDSLRASEYYTSLWVDDGSGNDRCVTDGGHDALQIKLAVSRT